MDGAHRKLRSTVAIYVPQRKDRRGELPAIGFSVDPDQKVIRGGIRVEVDGRTVFFAALQDEETADVGIVYLGLICPHGHIIISIVVHIPDDRNGTSKAPVRATENQVRTCSSSRGEAASAGVTYHLAGGSHQKVIDPIIANVTHRE